MSFLRWRGVLNRDYKKWMLAQTDALITGSSTRVLRYLSRPLTATGRPDGRSNNEVMSRVLDFHDGLRIRHWVDHNSVKVYNEQNVLRIETTINAPNMFQVYRRAQGQPPHTPKRLRPLRKGVADIPLRAHVSQEVNERLMSELSSFSDHLTNNGRQLISALHAMLSASTEQLLDMAA